MVVVFCCSGATCNQRMRNPFATGPQAPTVIAPMATAAEIIAAVNQNASRVRSYQAPSAAFTVPGVMGVPLLSGSIAAQPPLRMRLRAVTAVTGPQVDLGSNEERFWFWTRQNEPPGVYTARHDQIGAVGGQAGMPIDPRMMLDALGLVTLDPAAVYDGPHPRENGLVELRSRVSGPTGVVERLYVIDAARAWVTEQHVYDASGTLVASVSAERFRYDPIAQVSLPEKVTLRAPQASMAITVNTGPISVNAPLAGGEELWRLPTLDGVPVVDLATGAAPAMAGALSQPAPYGTGPTPSYGSGQSAPNGVSQPAWSPPTSPAGAAYDTAPAYDATHAPAPPASPYTAPSSAYGQPTAATPISAPFSARGTNAGSTADKAAMPSRLPVGGVDLGPMR
ncbi:hypothetical protein Mal64_35890 [Pseudobythopirellula maris]|uniref:Uncharacterized protein n=2 Tax=Pseudobythopirellula maris TaxID=2527991 RepID=A0A5C5ZH67_9BACT|nr:hypothetical protein Mal64_35890 [Pseudobythopirellula maris]